jgi:hypothetical protein
MRTRVDMPEASEMVVLTRLLLPGGIGDDVTVLPQQRLDGLEDARVTDGALHDAAAIEHLVPERSGFLGSVATIVGRVLVEDPADICTERCDLISGEHAVEYYVPIRLEALRRGGDRAGAESQVSG